MPNSSQVRPEWLEQCVRECQVMAAAIGCGDFYRTNALHALGEKLPPPISPLERLILDGLIARAARAASVPLEQTAVIVGRRAPTADEYADQALTYLQQHYAGKVTEARLARAVGIGMKSLHTAFLGRHRATPMAMLRAIRVEQAQRLLSGTDQRIGTIALLVGFQGRITLQRNFKRICGETPAGYRARHRSTPTPKK
jgi:AraC-like DNA-binding protein